MTTTVGDVKGNGNCKRSVCLMTAQAANNGKPGVINLDSRGNVSDGVPSYPDGNLYNADSGAHFAVVCGRESTLVIGSSAGSGTMTGTFTLWGYLKASNQWYPLAVNAASATPNTPVAIGETDTDEIRYQQRFLNLGHYDRFYLQLASVGGTATAFEAWLSTGNEGID